jgi:hypothetical protein
MVSEVSQVQKAKYYRFSPSVDSRPEVTVMAHERERGQPGGSMPGEGRERILRVKSFEGQICIKTENEPHQPLFEKGGERRGC